MFAKLNKEVFYPHPPEKVWQVITNSRSLAAWLMARVRVIAGVILQ